MTPLTLEWVKKAEGDFVSAQREFRARKAPNYDAACFHAQQCAEKYLKGRLQEAVIPFAKTHNLIALLTLLLPIEPTWASLHPLLMVLTGYAIDMRYPGTAATRAQARLAIQDCSKVRDEVRKSLGLS